MPTFSVLLTISFPVRSVTRELPTVFRFPGTVFFSLEPADILSTTLRFMRLSFRAVLVRVPESLPISLNFLRTLLLSPFDVSSVLIFGLLKRVVFRITVARDFFSPMSSPTREVLLELMAVFGLLVRAGCRVVVKASLFPPMDLPMRAVLLELIRLPELAVACLPALELIPVDFF